MMRKPGKKWIILYNLVIDLVMAVVMSVSCTLLTHRKIVFYPNLVICIALSFVLAFAISMLIPIPKISVGFAGLFHIRPHTLTEKLVGNILVSLIFTVIISGALWLCILYMENQMELFPRTFPGAFLPLFAIMYVVLFVMTPIAAVAANKACGRS